MQGTGFNVLIIAGLDPSGGAGLLADVKTCMACNAHAFGIVSANTVQHDGNFESLQWTDVKLMEDQIKLLSERYSWQTVKIGLVENDFVLKRLVALLVAINPSVQIIWDPVIRASAGFAFHRWTVQSLKHLLPRFFLVTPNRDELCAMTGRKEFEEAVKAFGNECNLLVKSAKVNRETVTDYLYQVGATNPLRFSQTILPGINGKHGSGCVLSSAAAAGLASGVPLSDAVEHAIALTRQFLLTSQTRTGLHYNLTQN
jgi:hydroxymethylpyrimidine/phosphomethylpyrimidine kinase